MLTRNYFLFLLFLPVLLDVIDMTLDLFYLNGIFEESILVDPDYVKPCLTLWMILSILKFIMLISTMETFFTKATLYDFEKVFVYHQLFELNLVFILEDSIMVYFQYFFYDKYSYSGFSLQKWSIRVMLANAIWKSVLYFWKLISIGYQL